MLATAAANLLRHFGVATTAIWVLGNTAEPLIIAALMQYYFGANFKIDRLYCVLGLFAAAVAGTAVASTWWTFVYYWVFASLNEPTATWLHWIVSDFAGIVSVAPLVIGIATAPQRPPARREAIESMAALAVLGAMSGVIVSLPLGLWETVVPAALVFPVLLWLAARWQPVFSAAGAFIVSMSVALTAIYGLGHFSNSGLPIGARVCRPRRSFWSWHSAPRSSPHCSPSGERARRVSRAQTRCWRMSASASLIRTRCCSASETIS